MDILLVMMLLNAGCGTHYAQGWVNTDVWSDDTTTPDVVVEPDSPYPFDDNTFDAIFMGHVLEHISWPKVPWFLGEMHRIAKPGANILIVGPDVYKTLDRWKANQEPWHMVMSVLEGQDLDSGSADWWDGATHHWNCHHDRVWKLIEHSGFVEPENYFDVIPNDAQGKSWRDPKTKIVWPVVGKWYWQFAIHCRKGS